MSRPAETALARRHPLNRPPRRTKSVIRRTAVLSVNKHILRPSLTNLEREQEIVMRIRSGFLGLLLLIPTMAHAEALRVSGAKKDDLQAVMAHLRANSPEIPIQFNNYR